MAQGSSVSWVQPLTQGHHQSFIASPPNQNSSAKPQLGFSSIRNDKCQWKKGAHLVFSVKDSINGSTLPDPEHNGSSASEKVRGPLGKAENKNYVDKSYTSFEGFQNLQPNEDKKKNVIRYQGKVDEDRDDINMRRDKKNEATPSTSSDTDSLWRSVFPSYMRSKEHELHQNGEGDTLPNRSVEGLGAHGVAAARAAAAAAASAMESHVNSFTNASSIASFGINSLGTTSVMGKKLKDLIADDPIWAAIRAEARLEAEREPLLSSFLYASILAHSCFERSLGFVLANRLKNATLLATQLMDVFDDVFMIDTNIQQAIRLDVQAVKDRDPSCRSYSSALLYLKGYHAVQSYRVAHALWNRGQLILALALQSRISEELLTIIIATQPSLNAQQSRIKLFHHLKDISMERI